MDKDKAEGGGLLGDRVDGRTEVASLEEFRKRARAVGFTEAEIDDIAKRYGWNEEVNVDGIEPKVGASRSSDMIWRTVLVVAIAAIVTWVAYWGWSEDERPQSGEALADVTVSTLTSLAVEGEALFNTSCAACHGTDAAGQSGIAPPLVHIIYEPNHHADAAFLLAFSRMETIKVLTPC